MGKDWAARLAPRALRSELHCKRPLSGLAAAGLPARSASLGKAQLGTACSPAERDSGQPPVPRSDFELNALQLHAFHKEIHTKRSKIRHLILLSSNIIEWSVPGVGPLPETYKNTHKRKNKK